MSTSDLSAPTRRFPEAPESGRRERHPANSCDGCFAVGDLIASRYELESVLAAGSMGRIWTARDNYMARRVAVKLPLCPDEQEEESHLRGELLFEARIAASVSHPAIIETFDAGITEEGESFVVFELLEGEDLRTRLQREVRLSGAEAVAILLPILDALGHLHACGIVHRDVKPANIFLVHRADGSIQPKLIDFGIAREVTHPCPAEEHFMIGSPSYMSPEQAHCGAKVDIRTDLWAAAVVLYEALAGNTPWHAPTWPSLVQSISKSPARSLAGMHLIDDALWRILERGLEKELPARWQSAEAFGAELKTWLGSPAAQPGRKTPRRRVARGRGVRLVSRVA